MTNTRRPIFITRGDMYYITRGGEITEGHEQQPGRPGIIVGEPPRGGATCMVVYLTTKRDKPDPMGVHVEIYSAPKPSVALCDQIKTVDTRCLDNYCGRVSREEMEKVDAAIATAMGLKVEREHLGDEATEQEKSMITALLKAEEQAESWRRVALHLMEMGA